MILHCEVSWEDYEPWSGAVCRWETIQKHNKEEEEEEDSEE